MRRSDVGEILLKAIPSFPEPHIVWLDHLEGCLKVLGTGDLVHVPVAINPANLFESGIEVSVGSDNLLNGFGIDQVLLVLAGEEWEHEEHLLVFESGFLEEVNGV